MKSFARKFLLVLFVTELVWAALLAFAPSSGQMRLFFVDEHGWFCDYRMPRGCADSERTYVPDETFRRDACYPPICYDFVKLFPHDRVRGGAMHAGFGVVVLALGLVVLLRRRMSCLSTAATMAAVLVSWPGLLTVGVSNQILFAAGFVCIFFAWHEDDAPLLGRFMPSLRRRHAALAFLALAIAFKLTPVFFALWLVRARRWREFVVVGVLSALLVFVPFAWHGGFEGFLEFLEDLRLHAQVYASAAIWGAVAVARYVALGLGVDIVDFRAGCQVWRAVDFAVAAVSLWLFFRSRSETRRMVFLVTAMLVAPAGNLIYTSLLLLPLMAMLMTSSGRESAAMLFLLLPCFVPIRIYYHGGLASHILPALSLYSVWLLAAVMEIIPVRHRSLPGSLYPRA